MLWITDDVGFVLHVWVKHRLKRQKNHHWFLSRKTKTILCVHICSLFSAVSFTGNCFKSRTRKEKCLEENLGIYAWERKMENLELVLRKQQGSFQYPVKSFLFINTKNLPPNPPVQTKKYRQIWLKTQSITTKTFIYLYLMSRQSGCLCDEFLFSDR